MMQTMLVQLVIHFGLRPIRIARCQSADWFSKGSDSLESTYMNTNASYCLHMYAKCRATHRVVFVCMHLAV